MMKLLKCDGSYLFQNEKENGPTYQFFQLISEFASQELKDKIQRPGSGGITIFVPSNTVKCSIHNANKDMDFKSIFSF